MLFAGHSHRQEQVSAKDLTWQEVIYKCRVKLQRVPLFYDDEEGPNQMRAQNKIEEYCYELCLIEDLEDGRVHDEEKTRQPGSYEDVFKAGLRARVPIHQISKLFYTNSGTLLGIEDSSSPVLLIKRDLNAMASRRLAERYQKYQYQFEDDDDNEEPGYALDMGEGKSFWNPEDEGQTLPEEYDLPRHLDPEWLAFEVFTEPLGDEDDFEADDSSQYGSQDESPVTPVSYPPEPVVGASSLEAVYKEVAADKVSSPSSRVYNSKNVKSSLSTLECLLRLTILQNYQQTSHLAVHDELLNLFLSDSAWSGSRESRQLERENVRKRIGFDPFGSPTKKQLPPKTAEEPSIGAKRDTSTAAPKDVNSLQGKGTPQRLPNTPHLDPRPPITPSSDRRKKASNIPFLGPVLWTPEQQLSSAFENTYISSPVGRKGGRRSATPEDRSN